MNIKDLTIGQVQEISKLFNKNETVKNDDTFNCLMGKYVIIRTYSAGVHAGVLYKKANSEVILKDSRRLHYWHCKKSIALSSIATYGLNEKMKGNRICEQLGLIWLDAIEIIPCTPEAEQSIRDFEVVKIQN